MSAAPLLRQVFGFDGFRPGQEEIVDAVAAGRNVLAIMPTGGGKSLCFQLPALVRGGICFVDVRDAGAAHVALLTQGEVGARILLPGAMAVWRVIAFHVNAADFAFEGYAESGLPFS